MAATNPLFTYQDIGDQLKVSPATVRRYVALGLIDVVHLTGKTRRIEQAAIDAFIARNRVPSVTTEIAPSAVRPLRPSNGTIRAGKSNAKSNATAP